MIPTAQVHGGQLLVDVVDHRPQVPPGHSSAYVQVPRVALPLDRVRVGLQRHVGDGTKPYLSPGRDADWQVLHVGDAVPGGCGAPHHGVVCLAGPEDVADLLARHQRGGIPAHVARLQAVPFRPGQIDGHIHLRDIAGDVPVRVHTRHGLHQREDLVRSSPQGRQVVAVGADDDGFLAAGQHLLDPLVEVGLHLPEQARVPVGDGMDPVQGAGVVRIRCEADPDLPEIHPGHFLAQQRLADVGTRASHPGDREQLVADLGSRALHLGGGGARRGDPVDEEIPFLEAGEQRLAQVRVDGHTGQGHQGEGQIGRDRAADDPGQPRGVSLLQPCDERRRAALDRDAAQQRQRQRRAHRERDAHRGHDRERVRQGQRLEERPDQPGQQEDRDQRRHDDERGVDDRAADLQARP